MVPTCSVSVICVSSSWILYTVTGFPQCVVQKNYRAFSDTELEFMQLYLATSYWLQENHCVDFDMWKGLPVSQFSHSVMSDSLWPHGLQHTRLPCPSPTPGACSNSWPSSQWCHPTISYFVIPFSSCLQSFPAFRGTIEN